ncbi:MAG: NUDIX hydrolase [bacterium]|nr:NUDIX hydrolase [bacterium]
MKKLPRPKSQRPVPDNAKCVFRGALFDVYQWKQKLFDGTFATFEKVKRREDTVTIIPITTDGKIISTREEQPGSEVFVSVPAGRMYATEDPRDAAKRELLEETGYAPKKLVLWDSLQPSRHIDWAHYIFIAHGCEKIRPQHLDAGEKIETRNISFAQFLRLAARDDFRAKDVALKVFRTLTSPKGEQKLRRMFGI